MTDVDATQRLERSVTDFRVEMATAVASIVARLDGMRDHDRRLRELEAGQQAIRQRMEADRGTVAATALALKEADDARRQKDAQPWVTPARMALVLAGVLGVAGYLVQAARI